MTGVGGPAAPAPARADRRWFALVLLLCAVAGALVLWSSGRTWTTQPVTGTGSLPGGVSRTGATLVPWVPALGWVALAGTGALIATRRAGRRVVAVLLLGCAAGVLAGAGYAVFAAPGSATGWPWLCAAAALVLAAGGAATLRSGVRWPQMGTRYDSPAPTSGTGGEHSSTREDHMWRALDRGEDPTDRGEDTTDRGEDLAGRGGEPADRGDDPAGSDPGPRESGRSTD